MFSFVMMTPEEIQEFYNKCHDKGGRFCEGEDGPGRVKDKTEPVSGKSYVDSFLSEEDTDTLRDYIKSSTHLNNRLRYGTIDPKGIYDEESVEQYHETVDENIQKMDSLFLNKGFETGGMTLYRGIRFEDENQAADVRRDWGPGEIIQDEGFLSSSSDFKTAHDYSLSTRGIPGIVLAISTRQNTKYLPGENEEYILNRGTPLLINSVSTDEDTFIRTINAEVI